MTLHNFEAVGGNYPDTCKQCGCFRHNANHFRTLDEITDEIVKLGAEAAATNASHNTILLLDSAAWAQRVAYVEAENARLRKILDFNKYEWREHLPTRVLALLADQLITFGKACEWLREYRDGVTGPLPNKEPTCGYEDIPLQIEKDRLEAENAELRRDRARLEWLALRGMCVKRAGSQFWIYHAESMWSFPGFQPTWREAIDVAMNPAMAAESKPGTEGK